MGKNRRPRVAVACCCAFPLLVMKPVGRVMMAAVVMAEIVMIPSAHAADSEATRIVAETVRAQGLPCGETTSADPDPAASRPDEAVWTLTCGNARYKVRFMGDKAAKIEPLE